MPRYKANDDEVPAVDDDGHVGCDGSNVYFFSDVTSKSVSRLVVCLRQATARAMQDWSHSRSDAHVCLYVRSDGGDCFAGLSAHDHITLNKVPVHCIADGMVASAGTFLFLAGSKRLAMPNAYMLIHQLRTSGFDGKFNELLDETRNAKKLMRSIRRIYKNKTNLTDQALSRLLKKEKALDTRMCLKLGLVDEVLVSV